MNHFNDTNANEKKHTCLGSLGNEITDMLELFFANMPKEPRQIQLLNVMNHLNSVNTRGKNYTGLGCLDRDIADRIDPICC